MGFLFFTKVGLRNFYLVELSPKFCPSYSLIEIKAVMLPQTGLGNALLQYLLRVRFYFLNRRGTPPRIDLLGVCCGATGKCCLRLSIEDEVDTFMY
ncbi:hypothetical protein BDGGKGIB_03986 [Nodularia sphaerocarpa UHCC 0038]|nr:hypothetical protein BDGGKGIB_03986 [Nodularia sphaerocarpa UHCC 0038]